MGKRYLLFASHAYSYAIMRPLQAEIRRRGGEAAWFLEPTCPDMLRPDELRLHTIADVMAWKPYAVFAPGNYIYDFFPGVKVELFHGFDIRKRPDKPEDHTKIRGWFDIYCTQGPDTTASFLKISERLGSFRVYETGWPKFDTFFPAPPQPPRHPDEPLTVLYSTTFTRGISSAREMLPELRRLAAVRPWHWIVTFHPKLTDPQLIADYEALAREFPNVEFRPRENGIEVMRRADVMLSDSSSIIIEFLMTGKPVVTLRNTDPGPYLIDVPSVADVEAAIERAATRPPELMRTIDAQARLRDPHRDGRNSARVLDAVDDFVQNWQGRLRRRSPGLFRKLKLRWQLRYFHL